MTSTIKERPILFSGPMVRAILEGRKTVTRRIVKPQYAEGPWSVRPASNPRHERHSHDWWLPTGTQPYSALPHCPYGRSGDRLWVRETYGDAGCRLTYRADLDDGAHCQVKKWTPAIHMFRQDSRILLEITAVRVERLQDISTEQIIAEGLSTTLREQDAVEDLKMQWLKLWIDINGAESWHANPWCWVIEFKRVMP